MNSNRNYTQIGIILDDKDNDGVDYRYPLMDMDYVKGSFNYNYGGSCQKSAANYDSRCTGAYRTLKNNNYTDLIYNEENILKVLLNATEGAFVYYLPASFFDTKINLDSEYTFFLTDITGNKVIRILPYQPTSQGISVALFPNDLKLQNEASIWLNRSYANLTSNSTSNFDIEGYNSEYLGGLIQLDVKVEFPYSSADLNQTHSIAAGVIVNKGYTLQTWNVALDDIIDTIITQMVIFLILLCITFANVWFLGMFITNRITYPIYLFEEYLKGHVGIQALNKSYNKEVNQILAYLRMLDILEKMINPDFLMNPKVSTRENNLKEALKLFEEIKNRRGISIIHNILGNIKYLENDYQKAVFYYKAALLEIEKLAEEVAQQESDEKSLSDHEKNMLFNRTGKESLSWESEKAFLQETIIDRKQQLCMGLQAELHESPLELSEIRLKLKEIYNYQNEILQYYASTRTNFLGLLKIMIDIAAVFQELKYYHSGLELLDLVHDELKKLEFDSNAEIDIDVTRLARIGVHIKLDDQNNKRLSFIVKGITYQKDILLQMTYYRRGQLLLENDKHYEAGLSFTYAIVINI
jgi:hypothetical protein